MALVFPLPSFLLPSRLTSSGIIHPGSPLTQKPMPPHDLSCLLRPSHSCGRQLPLLPRPPPPWVRPHQCCRGGRLERGVCRAFPRSPHLLSRQSHPFPMLQLSMIFPKHLFTFIFQVSASTQCPLGRRQRSPAPQVRC